MNQNIFTKNQLIKLYINKKIKAQDIADRYDVSNGTVYNYLKKYKILTHIKSDSLTNINARYWINLERHARERNIKFNITKQEAWNLFIKQNKRCAISGLEISINYKRIHKGATASLDRIDSSIGYFIDNIQWVHKDINRMKWDIKINNFYKYIKLIFEYKKNNSKIVFNDLNEINEISTKYLCSINGGIKRKNKGGDIDRKFLWKLFLTQGRKCIYSGLILNMKNHKDNIKNVSLDRIDSNIGYFRKNVQWIHRDINCMKQDFTEEKFFNLIKIIYKYNKLDK